MHMWNRMPESKHLLAHDIIFIIYIIHTNTLRTHKWGFRKSNMYLFLICEVVRIVRFFPTNKIQSPNYLKYTIIIK